MHVVQRLVCCLLRSLLVDFVSKFFLCDFSDQRIDSLIFPIFVDIQACILSCLRIIPQVFHCYRHPIYCMRFRIEIIGFQIRFISILMPAHLAIGCRQIIPGLPKCRFNLNCLFQIAGCLIKMIILKIRQSYDPIYREQDEQ